MRRRSKLTWLDTKVFSGKEYCSSGIGDIVENCCYIIVIGSNMLKDCLAKKG